jgi:hypothetical protein
MLRERRSLVVKRILNFVLLAVVFFPVCYSSALANERSRLAAVEQIDDQAKLAQIALDDKYESVSRAAVERLTDQTLLAKVALEAKHGFVRECAVEKLNNQEVLEKIALSDEVLMEGWKKDKIDTLRDARLVAVSRLTDQTILAKFALEYRDWDFRCAAVQRLTDPAMLAKAAIEGGECQTLKPTRAILDKTGGLCYTGWAMGPVRRLASLAIERLSDQTALANVAILAREAGARLDAMGKVSEEALLEKIVVQAQDISVRQDAAGRLTNQAFLAKMAVEEKDDDVRCSAIYHLEDQILLARVALEDKTRDCRLTAIRNMTDQALLAKVAVEDEDENARCNALDKLTNWTLLAKIPLRACGDSAAMRRVIEATARAKVLASIIATLPPGASNDAVYWMVEEAGGRFRLKDTIYCQSGGVFLAEMMVPCGSVFVNSPHQIGGSYYSLAELAAASSPASR